MKIKLTLLLLAVTLSFAQKNSVTVTVTNPLSLSRYSETISINLEGLYQHHPELKGKTLSLFSGTTELVSQSVDEDLDGTDDIFIFQSSFKSKETKQFSLRVSQKDKTGLATMVDARYVLPREDFAWENDRIAFRIYGNVVAGNVDNGIDVWTKRVRYPIVAKWYKESEGSPPGMDSYHQDRGEGADFFSVGRSLGAGSAGILWNGKLVQGGLFTHHRIITNGPIRTSFEVYYTNWKLDSSKFLEVKKITIDAGDQLNKIEEQFISNFSIESLNVAAGLVKRNFTEAKRSSDNRWLSLWGLTTADSVNGYLGTAVVFPYSSTVTAQEDSVQYLAFTSFNKENIFTYYSGAVWTRMGNIRTPQEWETYLSEFVIKKNHPLIVSFQQKKK